MNVRRNLSKFKILSIFIFVLISSCSTTSKEPDWVINYPSDNAYYIGIGASNTGNRAEDNEIAKKRALSNLAAEISSVIKSDASYTILSNDKGYVSKSSQEIINQIVEQNLKAVETVDFWYSKDYGCWYYLRLNRLQWAAIQAKEKKELENRVVNIIEPILNNKAKSLVDCVTALYEARSLLIESPYTEAIKSNLAGENGVFIDIINNKIISLLATLSIKINNEQIETEAGRPFELKLQVNSAERENTGAIKIKLLDKDNNLVKSLITDKNGLLVDIIKLSDLNKTTHSYMAEIDFDYLGYKTLHLPVLNFRVLNKKIKTKLLINADDNINNSFNLPDISASVESLLLEKFPITIDNNNDTDQKIEFDINYRKGKVPGYNNSLTFVFIKARISVIKEGKNISTYITDEFKGGGLDWKQANEKGLKKLFENLSKNEEFIKSISLAFAN